MPMRARSFGRLVLRSPTEMPSTVILPFWNGSSPLTHLDQRRLAGAGRPADHHHLALGDLRCVQSFSTWNGAVPLADVVADFDHGSH